MNKSSVMKNKFIVTSMQIENKPPPKPGGQDIFNPIGEYNGYSFELKLIDSHAGHSAVDNIIIKTVDVKMIGKLQRSLLNGDAVFIQTEII